jgi:hypothetical protein
MCFTCSRRAFLAGTGAVVAAGTLPAPAEAGGQMGCLMLAHSLTRQELHSSSGNPGLDRAMIAELRRALQVIPVAPGFKFFRDDSPNALATDASLVPDTEGTVLLGINLIRSEMEGKEDGGIAVAGICAHEIAHIYQFKHGWLQRLRKHNVAPVELQADFIAGYYMGVRQQFAAGRIQVFGESLFKKGDYEFNDPGHHGTPEQRLQLMMQGFSAGRRGVEFEAAAREGAELARTA